MSITVLDVYGTGIGAMASSPVTGFSAAPNYKVTQHASAVAAPGISVPQQDAGDIIYSINELDPTQAIRFEPDRTKYRLVWHLWNPGAIAAAGAEEHDFGMIVNILDYSVVQLVPADFTLDVPQWGVFDLALYTQRAVGAAGEFEGSKRFSYLPEGTYTITNQTAGALTPVLGVQHYEQIG